MSAGDEEKEILLGINEMVKEFSRQGKDSTPKYMRAIMNGMYGERALRISHRCFLHGMTQNLMILIKLSRSDQRILILAHRYRRMRAWYF